MLSVINSSVRVSLRGRSISTTEAISEHSEGFSKVNNVFLERELAPGLARYALARDWSGTEVIPILRDNNKKEFSNSSSYYPRNEPRSTCYKSRTVHIPHFFS